MAKVSKKDWVSLSSYLDGELNQKERKQVEQRIQVDPLFRAALEDLQTTKRILKSTPRLKVPRRFTLTPEMVGVKQRSHPARGYRLAAVVMTFLFVGLMVFDFGRSLSGVAFAPAAPREVLQESLPEAALDTAEEPALMAEGVELEAADRSTGESQADDMVEATAPAPAIAAEAEEEAVEELVEEEEAKSTDELGTDPAANQVDADQPEDSEEGMAPEPQPSQTFEPEPSQAPTIEETGEVFYDWEPADLAPGVDWIKVLEWVFGLGALVLGIIAWIKRRK